MKFKYIRISRLLEPYLWTIFQIQDGIRISGDGSQLILPPTHYCFCCHGYVFLEVKPLKRAAYSTYGQWYVFLYRFRKLIARFSGNPRCTGSEFQADCRFLPLLVFSVPSLRPPHPVLHPWNQRIDDDLLLIAPPLSSSVLVLRQPWEGAFYRLVFITLTAPFTVKEDCTSTPACSGPTTLAPSRLDGQTAGQPRPAGRHPWLGQHLSPAATAGWSQSSHRKTNKLPLDSNMAPASRALCLCSPRTPPTLIPTAFLNPRRHQNKSSLETKHSILHR